MNPKTILTEEGWDEVAPDCKGKDKELRKALFFYWSLEDDDFDFRGKALGKIAALASTLKAANEVKSDRDAVKYLTDVISASKVKQGELAKAKDEAEKAKALAGKAAAMTLKKADTAKAQVKEAEEKGEGEEEEDEEEEGDYGEKLKKALNSLKTAKAPYNFIVCDAKPLCGVVVSKQRIGPKHKEELTKVTGGSKRFLKPGTCRRDGTTIVFEMDNPPQGLATKLLKSIKSFTGIKYKVMVGNESGEDDEAQPEGGQPKENLPVAPPMPALAEAPEAWNQMRRVISTNIDQLKSAVRKEFAAEGADMVSEIDQNMKKLDGILGKLDGKLAESLDKARAANDPAVRKAELSHSKTLLANYIKFVTSEPMIAHIDSNPFGVKTNLKQTLTATLTQMAKAIG